MGKPRSVGPAIAGPEAANDARDTDVEKLLALLDPIVVNAPPDQQSWKTLGHEALVWLANTVSKTPWLNTIALLGVTYASGGIARPIAPLRWACNFLCWAIPDHYPDLAHLKVEDALVAFYGDEPHLGGVLTTSAISALQMYMTHFLNGLTPEQRKALSPFLIPKLDRSPRLIRLRAIAMRTVQSGRKEQAFAVVRELPALVALGRRRYKWLADLDQHVRQAAELVRQGQAAWPMIVTLPDITGQQEVVFRAWNYKSWVEAHKAAFSESTVRLMKRQTTGAAEPVLLQLVGDKPDVAWFLPAMLLGLLTVSKPSPEARQYLEKWHMPAIAQLQAGLLRNSYSMSRQLTAARRTAAGTPDDSRLVFCLDPLLVGAAIGQFVLIGLVQTGMRIGELMQVSLDKTCIETGVFPQYDDASGTWRNGPQQVYWRLYPKGSQKRERYLVTPQVLEAMLIMLDLHTRFYGPDSIRRVSTTYGSHFAHARRYPGKHKFVLQWAGQHLSLFSLEKILSFLLLEHPCRDQQGKPTHVTPHLLRHGVAGWLRNQGVPLEDIMALLKQVNIAVTDYYSKLSPQDLYQKIGPALTTLAELAGIDPVSVRSAGDIHNLMQEALKRYGALRHTPGGTCAVFTPCAIQFRCAGCPHYIPDPARRAEVQEKQANCAKAIQLFTEAEDYLQADNQRVYLHEWQRIEKEMEALAAVELIAPPAESLLENLGIDDLGKQLLLSLEVPPRRLPGGHEIHA